MAEKSKIIAIEEHFWIPKLRDRYTGYARVSPHHPTKELDDLGELRLAHMDEAGIDFQIISHMQPGTQLMDAESAVMLAREANDTLYQAMRAHPTRFGGFAELPTPDPKAAAAELERTVVRYGFKGALINGLTHGAFIDDRKFWGILERAQALDVPIYLHPAVPHPAVTSAYYEDYKPNGFPVAAVLWGFMAETGLQAIRLIQSGAFDKYPKLKFILGHLGESIPFMLWRCNWLYKNVGGASGFADAFREHFYLTTSGNFSNSALACSLAELGSDKIMFAVDWPFNSNVEGVNFVNAAPISNADRQRIFHRNAARLFGI
jgi:predicted TIM-barrel fold metal-dependent hydrolase